MFKVKWLKLYVLINSEILRMNPKDFRVGDFP